MQKVIRRTILAENQAARRLARRKETARRERAKSLREQAGFSNKDESATLKAARIARREDWELGPLAPRRDVGDAKDTYATINSQRSRGPELGMRERMERKNAVGGRYMNIVTGDRVVLLEGRDKGKIGKISNIDVPRGECTVEGLNMIDVAVPKWMIAAEESDMRPVRSIEKPVPLDKIRLIYPVTDPETGTTRDVIVRQLINGPVFHDRHARTTSWSRYIPGLGEGLGLKVPWPKKEAKEKKDHLGDTLRLNVEIKTFVPTLLHPPIPGSVIDELRNKYSKFRTRHDPEYIAEKMQEDVEKEKKKKMVDEMLTPLREANRLERKLKRAKGKGKLTEAMKERIGQLIAKKRQFALDVAGMSKVDNAPPEAVVA